MVRKSFGEWAYDKELHEKVNTWSENVPNVDIADGVTGRAREVTVRVAVGELPTVIVEYVVVPHTNAEEVNADVQN